MDNSIVLNGRTVVEALSEIAHLLQQHSLNYGHGIQTPIDEAAYLVSFIAGLPPDFDLQYSSKTLSQSEIDRLQEILQERIYSRVPLAYLLGETLLSGMKFFVDENVLIPRSPIAEMIEERFFPWRSGNAVHRILDLCTGSGCLGILAALEFPNAVVDVTDIDPKALKVANRNIALHGLETRVNAVLSDVYDQLPLHQYDIIIANPPYVPEWERSDLPSEFSHEPEHALFAGDDGLEIAERIIAGAGQYLNQAGILVLEVGQSAAALQARFPYYDFIWHELERGGEGVCVMTYEDYQRLAEKT